MKPGKQVESGARLLFLPRPDFLIIVNVEIDPLAFEETADGQFNFIIRGINFDPLSLGKTAHNDDPQQSPDFGCHSRVGEFNSQVHLRG